MTILGRHTLAESKALGNAVNYQFKQVDNRFKAIPDAWKAANPAAATKLAKDWAKATSDWCKSWKAAKLNFTVLRAASSAVSEDIIPAEDSWKALIAHTAQGGRNGDDSLYGVSRKVEEITGKPIDYSGQPSQLNNTDVDLANLNKLDGAIKEGEKKAKDAAKSSTVLYVGLGVAGALGLVVAAKVYL